MGQQLQKGLGFSVFHTEQVKQEGKKIYITPSTSMQTTFLHKLDKMFMLLKFLKPPIYLPKRFFQTWCRVSWFCGAKSAMRKVNWTFMMVQRGPTDFIKYIELFFILLFTVFCWISLHPQLGTTNSLSLEQFWMGSNKLIFTIFVCSFPIILDMCCSFYFYLFKVFIIPVEWQPAIEHGK